MIQVFSSGFLIKPEYKNKLHWFIEEKAKLKLLYKEGYYYFTGIVDLNQLTNITIFEFEAIVVGLSKSKGEYSLDMQMGPHNQFVNVFFYDYLAKIIDCHWFYYFEVDLETLRVTGYEVSPDYTTITMSVEDSLNNLLNKSE